MSFSPPAVSCNFFTRAFPTPCPVHSRTTPRSVIKSQYAKSVIPKQTPIICLASSLATKLIEAFFTSFSILSLKRSLGYCEPKPVFFKKSIYSLASLKEIFTFGVFRPSVYLIYILTVIFILYTGSNDVINAAFGTLTVCITYDALYTFYQLISKFFNPIQTLADQYNILQSSFAAAEKIFTILDIEPEIKDLDDAIELDIVGNIEFKNVWFSYVEDEWILKGVSFKINAKETVALVGSTGTPVIKNLNLDTLKLGEVKDEKTDATVDFEYKTILGESGVNWTRGILGTVNFKAAENNTFNTIVVTPEKDGVKANKSIEFDVADDVTFENDITVKCALNIKKCADEATANAITATGSVK